MQAPGGLGLSVTVCKLILTVELSAKDYMRLYFGETLLEKMHIMKCCHTGCQSALSWFEAKYVCA